MWGTITVLGQCKGLDRRRKVQPHKGKREFLQDSHVQS